MYYSIYIYSMDEIYMCILSNKCVYKHEYVIYIYVYIIFIYSSKSNICAFIFPNFNMGINMKSYC